MGGKSPIGPMEKKHKKFSKRRMLTELGLLLGALLLFWIIKAELLDLRYVPSSSMEPTICQGEWVLIDKLAGRFGDPDLYDLVMFRRPLERNPAIKRVAGLPGTRVEIVNGDLWFDGKISRKTFDQFDDVDAAIFDSRTQPLDEYWSFLEPRVQSLSNGKLRLESAGAQIATLYWKSAYLDEIRTHKENPDTREPQVEDMCLRIHLRAPQAVTFYALLGGQKGQFEWTLEISTMKVSAQLSQTKSGQKVVLEKTEGVGWPAGSLHELAFANFDNRLFLFLDGTAWMGPVDYEITPSPQDPNRPPLPPIVSWGTQSGAVEVDWFVLSRDLYYTSFGSFGVGKPFVLGQDEFFLLGDHSFESEDSRVFGPVSRRDILGQPVGVLFPLSKLRKL